MALPFQAVEMPALHQAVRILLAVGCLAVTNLFEGFLPMEQYPLLIVDSMFRLIEVLFRKV
jgi:hypothetical protein